MKKITNKESGSTCENGGTNGWGNKPRVNNVNIRVTVDDNLNDTSQLTTRQASESLRTSQIYGTLKTRRGGKDSRSANNEGIATTFMQASKVTTKEEEVKKCFLCGQPAQDQCTWCRAVSFCCEDHLRVHRAKSRCFPFTVEVVEGKGKGLVATRPIRARETILVESSVLAGPSLVTAPVCPGCLAPITKSPLPCTTCSLPICSPLCQESSAHRQECRLLSRNRVKVEVNTCDTPNNIYSFILPYRLLRLREKEPAVWHQVASLMDHIAERAGLGEWEQHQKDIVNFLRRRCFLGKEFSEEDIHRAVGIITVNSISLDPRRLFAGPSKGISGRAIFPTFALVNHSCLGNAKFSVDQQAGERSRNQHVLRLLATRDIKEGEEITVQYYSSLLGTHKRRRKLRSEWYFDCSCPRCKDPTECGTMVSAVVCELCEEGYMLPRDPLDGYSDWICSQCDFHLEVPDLERKVDQLEEELNYLSLKKDLTKIERFITEISGKVLHPHHYLMLVARRNYLYICHKRLIGQLSQCPAGDQEKVKQEHRRKTEVMQEFSWISRVLLGEE